MKKLLSKRITVSAVAVVAVIAFFSFKSGDDKNFQIAKNLNVFSAIVKELDMFYVDTLDPNKMVREGIDNMLYSLDPYTEYFPEEDQSELEQMIKGSFGGIGSYITYDTKLKRSVISEPFENTPAAKVGLKAGDILVEIDGKDLLGKNNAEVSQMLRGQAGTSFKLKVDRPNLKGTYTPLEFTIVRESIQNPSIPYASVLENHVGYINLSTFSGNPSKDFKKTFLDLKKKGATSLVIDLRNNGGGLLDEAVEIANYFLPRGKVIVTTKGKIKQASNSYKTLREPLDLDIPVAVLVNSATASASEILSGSLQDLDRAVVVGNRTFGKGLVQVPRSLPYGGTMKVTTSKYYIPSGRCVQAIDYKNRNEDGSVGAIPDSLTKIFHTAAGREVRDGGGVMPDIAVKQEKLPNILFYLVRDNLVFDYATQYCLKHPTIASPEKFELTASDYTDFKATVKKADFKYDQQSEKILKTLKEAAEFEGYMKDASDEFKALEKKLNHNLERDLDYFSKDIKRMITNEIVKRYYFQRGSLIQQLKDDNDLEAAIQILNNPAKYKEMLSVPAVAKK
ncbi:S41 family peptidase [Bacteroides reticulotermitis]|uniref:Carboxy-terminal processing protease n=2 Tax=Bacteroides reticulotermitis TaxID=1133319 RepID=W4V149_9BACE|nr:S41 family peptidase [Bacteroides reticulotermitis]MBB4044317.1 carboxyl-terminal processing protease [Bacteroides reticulotermitis]GAE86523.1 carboxy-terminal processing protease [Bacteroides reticulotermitis JCM 10512]HJD75750.1 S41 family peptidase [Bacteroides reticulotermitis]